MNTKLIKALFVMVVICQLHAVSFLIPWNGDSLGNHL